MLGMAEAPIELVRRFCSEWSTMSVDDFVGYFTDDAVYHNVPMEPCAGRDAIRKFAEEFMSSMTGMEVEIHHILADGPIVVTERTDVVHFPHATVRVPIMGIFEIEDGRIAGWREYFDIKPFEAVMPPGAEPAG
jgi:limonene-1,2-epoxide hydrolase